MLRSRFDTNRIVPSEQERDELLRLGAQLDHNVGDLVHVVRRKHIESGSIDGVDLGGSGDRPPRFLLKG